MKIENGIGDRALTLLGDELGAAYQLSMSDESGYPDDQRWWCWLPKEYGGDGTIMANWTPLGAVEAAVLWKNHEWEPGDGIMISGPDTGDGNIRRRGK